MTATARTHWLSQLLGLLPARLHEALNAWSYGVARQRADKRRQAAGRTSAIAPVAAVPATPDTPDTSYRLRPWRD